VVDDPGEVAAWTPLAGQLLLLQFAALLFNTTGVTNEPGFFLPERPWRLLPQGAELAWLSDLGPATGYSLPYAQLGIVPPTE
jgi:hypothetical protein